MVIFSFVLVLATLLNVSFGKNSMLVVQTFITVFVCCFVNVGYFLSSDLISVDYYQAVLILQLFVSVLVCFSDKDSIKLKVSDRFLLYLLGLVLSVVSLVVFPAKNAHVTGAGGYYESFMLGRKEYLAPEFTKFTVFFLALAIILAIDFEIIVKKFKQSDWVKLVEMTAKSGKIIIVVIIAEFIIKNVFRSNLYSLLLNFVFGKEASGYYSLVFRDGFAMLQGFTRECSHLSYGICIIIVALFTEKKVNPTKTNNTFWIAIALGELFASGSFTTFWCLAFIAFWYFIYIKYSNNKYNKRFVISKKVFIFLFVLLFIVLLFVVILVLFGGASLKRINELFEVLNNIDLYNAKYFETNYHISSNQTRIYSIVSTFNEYLNRPLFGLGLGTTYCYSDTILTLSEIGLINILFFSNYYFNPVRDHCSNRKKYYIYTLSWLIFNIFIIFHSRLIVSGDLIILIAFLRVLLNTNINRNNLASTHS